MQLLQRSLARGRLGHAYLFAGDQLAELAELARALAQTLNCLHPVRSQGVATDACDRCANCRKIAQDLHPDVHWVRPESKLRVITVDQMRELMQEMQLKPSETGYKVAIIEAADRLNTQAANAFLKTLEEPPDKSVLILLSTEPQRLLPTILSRCLRLNFFGDGLAGLAPADGDWLARFGALAGGEPKSLMGRYCLLDVILQRLGEIRAQVDKSLSAHSPLEQHEDVEKGLRDKWETELAAAIEAEYRRRRAELLMLIHWWLRDAWIQTLGIGQELLKFPQITGAEAVARRITARQALENLKTMEQTQRLLHTNVQEALALEVGLLKLHF